MSEQAMRDPRVDPRAGDVVRNSSTHGHKETRIVEFVDDTHVVAKWSCTCGAESSERWKIQKWRRNFATATIIHVAEG